MTQSDVRWHRDFLNHDREPLSSLFFWYFSAPTRFWIRHKMEVSGTHLRLTMEKNAPEIIESPLSQMYTANGETIEVSIYRLKHTKWKLEVTDSQGTHTVWDDDFNSDQDAWAEFLEDVTKNGIAQFIAKPSNSPLH